MPQISDKDIQNQTGVAGSYTNANVTFNSEGIATAASSGTGGSATPPNAYEVLTSDSDYTLTNAYAGIPNLDVTLAAGSYELSALLEIAAGATANDLFEAKFYNATDSVDVAGSERRLSFIPANSTAQMLLRRLVTVSSQKIIQVYAQNATAARGKITAARSTLDYIGITVVAPPGTTGKPASGTPLGAGSTASGLVLCYPMWEGTGTSLSDRSSTGVNAALSGTVSWQTDTTFTNVLNFSAGVAQIAHNAAYNLETFSICLGFKSSQSTTGRLFIKTDAGITGNKYPFDIRLSGGNLANDAFNNSQDPNIVSSSTVNNNAWRQAILTRAAQSQLAMYVDGASAATAVTDNTGAGTTTNTLGSSIGANVSTGYYVGLLAYLFMWNRVLTSTEIAALYADPFAMFR